MSVLKVIAIFAFFATLIVLVLGLGSMALGGKRDREQSTKLMSVRTIYQAIALLAVLGIAAYTLH